MGEITRDNVESVTYQVTYLGKLVTADAAADNADDPAVSDQKVSVKEAAIPVLPYVTGGLAVAAIITLAVMLMRSRKELRMLQEPEDETDNEMEDEEK